MAKLGVRPGARAPTRHEHGAEPPVTLALEFGPLSGSGPHDVATHTGYDGEVRHFLACVAGVRRYDESPTPAGMLADAPGLARLLQAEARSLATGRRDELEGAAQAAINAAFKGGKGAALVLTQKFLGAKGF